jgi:DNA-binding PadR family transcriptional regulator
VNRNPEPKSEPIRLSATSYAVLALLEQFGDSTSYDIKQAIERSIANFWNPSFATSWC